MNRIRVFCRCLVDAIRWEISDVPETVTYRVPRPYLAEWFDDALNSLRAMTPRLALWRDIPYEFDVSIIHQDVITCFTTPPLTIKEIASSSTAQNV